MDYSYSKTKSVKIPVASCTAVGGPPIEWWVKIVTGGITQKGQFLTLAPSQLRLYLPTLERGASCLGFGAAPNVGLKTNRDSGITHWANSRGELLYQKLPTGNPVICQKTYHHGKKSTKKETKSLDKPWCECKYNETTKVWTNICGQHTVFWGYQDAKKSAKMWTKIAL